MNADEREALAYAIYDGGPSREDFLAGIEHLVDQIAEARVRAALDQLDERARVAEARLTALANTYVSVGNTLEAERVQGKREGFGVMRDYIRAERPPP